MKHLATLTSLAMLISGLGGLAVAQEARTVAVQPGTRMSPAELELWNDPAFKRQFIMSYQAETEIEPRVTEDERKKMVDILELISSDKMDEAGKQLEKELSRNEAASAVFDFTLANINFQRDRLDEAAAHYEKAVEKFPKFQRAWKNLGLIHVRQGEFQKALTPLTKVVEFGGNDAITYGLLGFAYSSVENYLSAEQAYQMAILLDPVTMDWKMGLARSFFKQERYAEAAALCGQLLKGSPERTDLWLLQANAYIGLNRPVDAAEIYELVDQLGGSTPDSLNMLGDIYVNEELYGLAAGAYTRAMVKGATGRPDRAMRAAKVLAARGALDETREIIDKVEAQYGEQLTPEDRKDVLKLRARMAVAEGSGEEEVRVLEEIVELDPLDGEALILLGQNCARNGDTEKAIFYYERAEKIEAFEADAKIRHAQLLVGNGKYGEALPLLRSAQQLKPRENVQKYLDQVERVTAGGRS